VNPNKGDGEMDIGEKCQACLHAIVDGEDATRNRKHKGQYDTEELRRSAFKLQQTLGRIPTRDETMFDMSAV
jgi:hypothetical protein